MKNRDYLTIEETAGKLGRPATWVKEQICEGKLGATLAGRQWLIPSPEVHALMTDNSLPHQPSNVVHNFLPDRPAKKFYDSRNDERASRSNSRSEATERSRKPPPSSKNSRAKKRKGSRPTLIQKIKKLDRKFDQQCTELRTAMLEYRVAVESGKEVKPPRNLLRQWKSAKAELKFLVAKATSKGLVLPSDLHIYKVLAQEAETVKKSVVDTKPTRAKPATTAAGIDGYYGGPSRMNPQETQKLPGDVEARLMILRIKQRAAAHDMRDRGKSKAARNAAELDWARARQEAEKLERQAARSAPPHPLHPGRT
jgi:excisionase family DNA binding protein